MPVLLLTIRHGVLARYSNRHQTTASLFLGFLGVAASHHSSKLLACSHHCGRHVVDASPLERNDGKPCGQCFGTVRRTSSLKLHHARYARSTTGSKALFLPSDKCTSAVSYGCRCGERAVHYTAARVVAAAAGPGRSVYVHWRLIWWQALKETHSSYQQHRSTTSTAASSTVPAAADT